jgi:hypothetical protein
MRFLFSFISRFHKIDLSTNSTKSSSNDRIMIALNLPTFEIKLSGSKQHPLIFDILRRKRVALTPEEWVRQHFIHYLIEHKGYPAELLANEIKLQIGNKNLRADSVLYDRNMHPQMIIEYKAPSVALTQHVFDQIFAYNTLLHVNYIIVSNGLNHYCCHIDYQSNTFNFIKEIPDYNNL